MKNYFLSIVLLTVIVHCSFAQTEKQKDKRFSVHLGSSIPISDFGSDNLDNAASGFAAPGLNVGLEYIYPLSETGLDILLGIDFGYNGFKKEAKDKLKGVLVSNILPENINDVDIKYYKYINVPITAGLSYTFKVDDEMAVFANARLALNFLKITDFEVEYAGAKEISKHDLANNLGFKIGGGFLINQKISVSIDYLGLGEHDINVTTKHTADTSSEKEKFKVPVDLLTIALGYRF